MPDKSISSETNVLVAPIDLAKLYAPFFHQDGTPSDARANMAEVMKSPSQVTISKAWSGSGVGETPFLVDATDPGGAADAASKLLDLRLGGGSKLAVTKQGFINTSYVANTPTQHVLGGWGLASDGNGPVLYGTQAGAHRISRTSSASSAGLYLYGIGGEITHLIGSVALGGPAQDPNTFLVAEAPYVLAQRYGSNAELLRVYETYTNGTTFSRGVFGFRDNASGGTGAGSASTGVLRIGTEKGLDGGTAAAISIVTNGTERIGIAANGDISLGVHTALAAEVVTGYITIKDSAGNTRKLAVVS